MIYKRYIKSTEKRILSLILAFVIFLSGVQMDNVIYADDNRLVNGTNEQQLKSGAMQQDKYNAVPVTAEAPIGDSYRYRSITSIVEDLNNIHPTDNLSTQEEDNSNNNNNSNNSVSMVPIRNFTYFIMDDNSENDDSNECRNNREAICELIFFVIVISGMVYGVNQLFK